MPRLREVVGEYREELREGIAWVIIWKNENSWSGYPVWLLDDGFEPEDEEMIQEILRTDRDAIIVNGYYSNGFYESASLEVMSQSALWNYTNHTNQLSVFDPKNYS